MILLNNNYIFNKMTTIENLLRINYVEGIFHTHVSMIEPRGKYNLSRDSVEELWKLWSFVTNSGKKLGLAEKPQYYLPVLGDIDIKVKMDDKFDEKSKLYDEEHISSIVEIYQSVLRKIVDGCTDDNLLCVLLEKPPYIIERNGIKYKKNGIHIHFPWCFLSKVEQEVHLIPRVQAAVDDMKLFEDLGYVSSAKIIDGSVCTNPWLMYGCRKDPKMDTYVVTKIFNSEGENISLEEAFKNYSIFDHKEQIINIKGKVKEYLPRILSVLPYGRETHEIKQGLISPIKEKIKIQNNNNQPSFKKISVLESLKKAQTLLNMLLPFRASDYNEWIRIGWLLYNISDGSPEGLDLWCEFSSQCEDTYDESVCIHNWDRMVQKDLTLGSLRYCAKIDNPQKYKEFCDKESEVHYEESLSGSHNDIAKILFTEHGDNFVCASITGRIWFQFRNHIWEQIEEGVFLREKISNDIVAKFSILGQKSFDDFTENKDKSKNSMHSDRLKRVQKMVGNLKSAPYKNNIMKEAQEVFYDRRFRAKLDTEPYLIAFKNGVYDLKQNMFRPGMPEDFLSKSLSINYNSNLEDSDEVRHVHTFLEQVFPDKSIRKYFLDTSSDIFVGGNHQKIVLVWTGDGDNAKSVTQTIFEKMLGELAIKLNTTVVTGKKVASGSANADLARAGGGVRWAVMEEPGGDEMINDGILNNLSGNDSFYARDLFEKGKDGREIAPLFKLVFICLSKGTSITLNSGVSVSIEKLTENHHLLSWDSKTNGLVPTKQQKFIDNGEQDCIRLTLRDGRQITCTPNHKYLTSVGEWIEAKDIKLYNTQLKMGVSYPKADDMFDDYDYIFNVGDMKFNLSCHPDRLKASALCRIIGYIITDGSSNKKLYIGRKIDAQNILDDIAFLTNKTQKICKGKPLEPFELTKAISAILPEYQKMQLPNFLFDRKFPTFLIRELLGGMFGADSVLSIISKKQSAIIQLVVSKEKEQVESLVEEFRKMSVVLLERFGIESIVEKDKYNVFLRICKDNSILQFTEKIGVRYCSYNSYKLTAIGSMLRYKQTVINQNQAIINITRELVDKYKKQNINHTIIQLNKQTGDTIKEAFENAKTEVKEKIGLSDEKNIITYEKIKLYYLEYKNDSQLIDVEIEEYLNSTGLVNFYNEENMKKMYSIENVKENVIDNLPFYEMSVINVENVGKKHVYDLNVEEPYSNFIAEGIVTHNCNKLPKLRYNLKATWNRIRVIPFESTFVRPNDPNPPPESYEEQLLQKRFPMDKNFTQKIPGMLEAFAWILLEHRKYLTVRIEPDKVRMATELYRKQNDTYRQFCEESIIEDYNSEINLIELYAQFKEWYKESLPNHTLPIKNQVEEYFTKLWDEPLKGKRWKGYRIRNMKDDKNDLDNGNIVLLDETDLVDYSNNDNLPPSMM